MPRDPTLEAQIAADLAGVSGLVTKRMFGGLAWMWRGHLLCAAGGDGLLVRLGKGGDAWALVLPDVDAMTMGGRPMQGWVRLAAGATGDSALRRRLLDAAQGFVASLPPK